MDAEHASRDHGRDWKAVESVVGLPPELDAEPLGDDLPESVERVTRCSILTRTLVTYSSDHKSKSSIL
jgi:hypothetical protein